jgi:two-component system, chemotaxis family, protein-glutamate methylesterase/glutaminase
MWELDEGDLVRYPLPRRPCLHGRSDESCLDNSLRRAMASALRALEERIERSQSLQKKAKDRGRKLLAEIWEGRAQEYALEAKVIRSSMKRADDLAAEFAQTDSSAAQ